MSDSALPEKTAFAELEQLVKHLGDELASFRRRALQAEARLKGLESTGVKGVVSPERVQFLERENAGLTTRLEAARTRTQQMIDRVRFYTDPEAEKAGYDKMTTIIKIHLKDGRVIAGRADFGKGSPANPMSYNEVADKFRGCAAFAGWPDAKAGEIIEFVRNLDRAPDVRPLSELCSR